MRKGSKQNRVKMRINRSDDALGTIIVVYLTRYSKINDMKLDDLLK